MSNTKCFDNNGKKSSNFVKELYRNVWIKTEPTEFNVQNYSTEILYLLLSLSTNSFSFLWGTKL